MCIEGPQIVDPLSDADKLNRDAKLLLNGDCDAALGRAVQLRQYNACHFQGLGEPYRLLQLVQRAAKECILLDTFTAAYAALQGKDALSRMNF